MTIAIGLLCDEGAVLVTDSLSLVVPTDGVGDAEARIHNWRTRFAIAEDYVGIHSGECIAGDWILPGPESSDWRESARRFHGFMASAVASKWRLEERRAAGGATGRRVSIVAAVPQRAGEVRMGRLSNQEPERWLSEPGIVFSGCITAWAERRAVAELAVPASLEEAALLGASLGAAYLRDRYEGRTLEELLREELLPPAGYPMRAIGVDEQGWRRIPVEHVHAPVESPPAPASGLLRV